MIVNFPTGLYETVLPQRPADSGNVTYTISNSAPPRTDLVYPKVPTGVVNQTRGLPTIDFEQRRRTFGSLLFTITGSRQKIIGTGARQYEIGQLLEFASTPVREVDVMLVSPITETRHDTNLFDYDSLGATADEQAAIQQQSQLVYDQLSIRINEIRTERANAEIVIGTQQKIINEADRNIAALQVIVDNSDETASDLEELMLKLQTRRATAITVRDAAVTNANALAAEAVTVQNQLVAVSLVVK